MTATAALMMPQAAIVGTNPSRNMPDGIRGMSTPSAPDNTVQKAMDQVVESDAVQQMISEVQDEYHAVVDVDPDLSAYMDSIE